MPAMFLILSMLLTLAPPNLNTFMCDVLSEGKSRNKSGAKALNLSINVLL
jgi:hypothetical protein